MTSLEFTGERYIPGHGGARIAYEHVHRYLFATQWAKGKDVLDVATGSGYGAALMASVARRVCAIELDWAAAIHASGTHCSLPNLLFVQGDATCLPVQNASADLVVALEILEHVTAQEGLVREIARAARPEGLVLISTPDKAVYSDAREYSNPFHVREFYRDEFVALLEGQFRHVRLFHQQVRAGSLVTCAAGCAGCAGQEVIARPLPFDGQSATPGTYFLALCSHRDSLDRIPSYSVYVDTSDALEREWREEILKLNGEIKALGHWGHGLEAQIEQLNAKLRHILDEVEERDQTIRGLQLEKGEEIARRDSALVHLQEEFEGRTRWAMDLQKDISERDIRIREANTLLDDRDREIRRLGGDLARIRHALMYRILCRMKILPR